MEKKKHLRQSLPAKCVAVLLLFAAGAGAVIGTFAVTLLSCGYGAADHFQEDPLGKYALAEAMSDAVYYVRNGSGRHSTAYYQTLLERAGGFSAVVYGGKSASGTPLGGWGEVPADYRCRAEETIQVWTSTVEDGEEEEWYTVVGYIALDLPSGSDFSIRYNVYYLLRSLSFSGAMALTVLACILALAALIFLFCAAGHKAGREGISLNWQDRIPLDLYLCLAVVLACLAALPFMASDGAPLALQIAISCLTLGAEAVLALAAMLTLAARFKKGKWWRNT
ncbi:MAG: hypothetical protein K2O45_16005, partial [Oscillospiraceae bacterium]|nr:hypothetical protein [Oscillospiraceae bacterium]